MSISEHQVHFFFFPITADLSSPPGHPGTAAVIGARTKDKLSVMDILVWMVAIMLPICDVMD